MVVGGGFIGLETAENLVHLGFDVTLVEMLDQVLAPLDREIARLVEEHLKRHGVHLALGDGVAGFKQLDGGALEVQTQSGKTYPADIVILALGVRPDTTLAKAAGLEIGERGGIRVDDQMRTSDPDIFAVGDAIEVKDFVTGEWSLVALAGPGEPAGPHRGRRDRRARFALSAARRARRSSACSAARPPGPASARRRCSGSATRTTRRSTSSRTRTPATTRARR